MIILQYYQRILENYHTIIYISIVLYIFIFSHFSLMMNSVSKKRFTFIYKMASITLTQWAVQLEDIYILINDCYSLIVLIFIFQLQLFTIGFTFRIVSFYHGTNYFIAARLILCLDLFFWFMRLLHVFKNFKNLGPKIKMITRMVIIILKILFSIINNFIW